MASRSSNAKMYWTIARVSLFLVVAGLIITAIVMTLRNKGTSSTSVNTSPDPMLVGSVACRYSCTDPVCTTNVCKAICSPECRYNDDNSIVPSCTVSCPPDMMATEDCPSCESKCPDADSTRPFTCQTSCSWQCDPLWAKPGACPKPVCTLQCDEASCLYTPE